MVSVTDPYGRILGFLDRLQTDNVGYNSFRTCTTSLFASNVAIVSVTISETVLFIHSKFCKICIVFN
jgi:hypothetical protein